MFRGVDHFSIIGIKVKNDLGLNDTQFGVLIATPILTDSLSRISLGVWAAQYGGRLIFTLQMPATVFSAFLPTKVSTYPMFLMAALGVGLAGGSFAVGIQYVCSKAQGPGQDNGVTDVIRTVTAGVGLIARTSVSHHPAASPAPRHYHHGWRR